MALFMVIALGSPAVIDTNVSTSFPEKFLKIAPDKWLIVASGTAKDVCDKLGISGGTAGTGIVMASAGYYGHAPQNIWEWIVAKTTTPSASPSNV